jgi:multidrug efflux system membrane fusion protein
MGNDREHHLSDENAAGERGSQQPRRSIRPAFVAVAVILVAGIAGFSWHHLSAQAQTAIKGQASRAPVPVSVAMAKKQDVPMIIDGLGTVQPTFTVGIHSQIDGKLQDVLFVEGQRVKKGDLLAKIDPRLFQAALDQAKAKKAQDDATLVGYQKDLERFTSLGNKGYETQQNIDNQQAKVASTQATIQADAAAIETAQTQLDYTDIRAPSDGRMGVRMVDPGNVVHASDSNPIGILVQTQPTNVQFTLPEQTLDTVRAAQAAGTVPVMAYDRDNKLKLSDGTLVTIDNQIDQTTATYKLKARFANEDEKLWAGEFVNARLQVGVRKDAIVVPDGAIQRGPNGLFAWVIDDDNKAGVKPIKVAQSSDGITVVTEGINVGEKVVTDGQFKLTSGAEVRVAPDSNAPNQTADSRS